MRNLKVAFSPTPTPDASQWNIGCVGSQSKMLALAMYISCFLCRFHLRLVTNANPISSGIWALNFIIQRCESFSILGVYSSMCLWVISKSRVSLTEFFPIYLSTGLVPTGLERSSLYVWLSLSSLFREERSLCFGVGAAGLLNDPSRQDGTPRNDNHTDHDVRN